MDQAEISKQFACDKMSFSHIFEGAIYNQMPLQPTMFRTI